MFGLLAALYAGAQVDMLPRFNAERFWSKLLGADDNITMFFAVPTIYVQLTNFYAENEALRAKYSAKHVKQVFEERIRIVTSASAPLTVKAFNKWLELTGKPILERYGMTEIGSKTFKF